MNTLPFKYMLRLAVALCTLSGVLNAQSDGSLPKTNIAPTIDGQIDDIWHAQPAFHISSRASGSIENAADSSGDWYGLWDDTNFYFLIEVQDQILDATSGTASWQNDIIEVYFNMDNVKTGNAFSGDNYQYAFYWSNDGFITVSPNGKLTGAVAAQTTTSTGYIMEVKIPWTTLTTLPTGLDFNFGFDIAINDNDGLSSYDSVIYWHSTNALWTNIANAGTVALADLFDGNYPPQITALETQIAREGTPSSFLITASDINASDTLTFSATDLPSFISMVDNGNGTASININAVSGDAEIYPFSVSVSDGSKSASKEYTVIVKDPNVETQKPVFEDITSINARQGNQRILNLTVTDIDSLSLDISAPTLPAFATFADNGNKTATITFTPGSTDAIQGYTVSVEAVDEDSNLTTLNFTLNVLADEGLTAFYCDPTSGNIENSGSAASPWSTLEDVIDAGIRFDPGDIIYLNNGNHGNVLITAANSAKVEIIAASGHTPTLTSLNLSSTSSNWDVSGISVSPSFGPNFPGNHILVVSGQNNRVSNATVFTTDADTSGWTADNWKGWTTDGVNVTGSNNILANATIHTVKMGIDLTGSFNTVTGTRIKDFTVDGIRAIGNDLLIENNYISDNYNIDDNHDDGIQSYTYGDPVYRITIRGNKIVETTDPTRPFQGSLQGIGCFDGMFEGWLIENNVIVVNQYHGIALYGAIECKIINNTVLDQNTNSAPNATWITIEPHKKYAAETDPTLKAYYRGRDNLVRNNLATSIIDQPNLGTFDNNKIITASSFDTYFVSYPFDLHLKEGSPAIDAGTNTGAPSIDADGATRPADGDNNGSSIVDWGAYEYSGTWRGVPRAGNFVEISDNLGWFAVHNDPWVFSYVLDGWIYLSPSWTATDFGWLYISR